jgi:rhamnogalacturonyl hydrolase YesR
MRSLFIALCIATLPSYAQTEPPFVQPPVEWVGDAVADPGPIATDLATDLRPASIKRAMRKVADWQLARIQDKPSQDWTFGALYAGLIAASESLDDPRYAQVVERAGEQFHWELGPRESHADDQAIGQSYLALYRRTHDRRLIAPLRAQFDRVLAIPDDPSNPVWWWCDALFMAPRVWAGLAQATGDPRYLEYMDRQWRITTRLLYDPKEHLYSRDASFLERHEANGRKLFWSRGNGWVMGGIVRVLEIMPADHPGRARYIELLREMSEQLASIQGADGLWRPGLLDASAYPYPEVSGSAFFTYALAWGINHGILDRKRFTPVATRAWRGLVSHIYKDGRLGSIQPIGAAPDAFQPSSSYVYGVGAFLLAGSEVVKLSVTAP